MRIRLLLPVFEEDPEKVTIEVGSGVMKVSHLLVVLGVKTLKVLPLSGECNISDALVVRDREGLDPSRVYLLPPEYDYNKFRRLIVDEED